MQFQKKTRVGSLGNVTKIFIKLVLIILFIIGIVILLDKINFPSPNKLIEKNIPNENFKIIK